jgi:hypothetical protein
MKHLGGHHNRLLDEVGGGRHGSRGRELGGFIRAVGADVGGCSRRPLLRLELRKEKRKNMRALSYGPPWAHYLGGYQDRLLGGPLGLPDLCHTVPDGVRRKDYGGEVLG